MLNQLLPVAIFNDVGGLELVVIAGVALLLFGKDMPVMTRKIGKMVADFKRTMNEASTELRKEMDSAASELEKAGRDAEKAMNEAADAAKDDMPPAQLPPPATTEVASTKPAEPVLDSTIPPSGGDPGSLDKPLESLPPASSVVHNKPATPAPKLEGSAAPGLNIKIPTQLPPSVS